MSLRLTTRKKPQVSLRGLRLTGAQKRAMRNAQKGAVRGAQMLRDSRLTGAQKRAIRSAQQTAQRLSPTAEQARQIASTRMQSARVWSAPRIDRAGRYVERELG